MLPRLLPAPPMPPLEEAIVSLLMIVFEGLSDINK